MAPHPRYLSAQRRERYYKWWLPSGIGLLVSLFVSGVVYALPIPIPIIFIAFGFFFLTLEVAAVAALFIERWRAGNDLKFHPTTYCQSCGAYKGGVSVWCRYCGAGTCWRCGYNLFNNRSCVCPECGAPYCSKCGGSLYGEPSGRCPECGELIPSPAA